MKYFFNQWDSLKGKLRQKCLFLFLDYDGTLAPIAETPHKAIISKETRALLERLAEDKNCRVAVISGRGLRDIKERIGLKNIIYVGNHGLELEGPKIRFEAPVSPRYKKALNAIKNNLSQKLAVFKGAMLEDKGLSLSLHYRRADRKSIPQIKTAFHEAVIVYLVKNRIRIKPGKMVLEIRPPLEWDKGKMALWLLARQRFTGGESGVLPLYVGDDITDEDAFKALKHTAVTIFIGKPRSSYAKYYLKDTSDVRELLRRILETQKGKNLCRN